MIFKNIRFRNKELRLLDKLKSVSTEMKKIEDNLYLLDVDQFKRLDRCVEKVKKLRNRYKKERETNLIENMMEDITIRSKAYKAQAELLINGGLK